MDSDPASTGLTLFLALSLIAANALLAAAEFSLIAVRRTRIEQTARLGDRRAARVIPALDGLENLAFAAQVGRSLASVLLGWCALRVARGWLVPAWGPRAVVAGIDLGPSPLIAAVVALVAAALLHATLGQQVPKLVAVNRAEWIASRVSVPVLGALRVVLSPVLAVLNVVVRVVLRVVGVDSASFQPLVRTPEEIRTLVVQGGAEQTSMEDGEREMLRGVFEFSGTVAREVMTPRTEMVAVPVDVTLDELIRVATEEGHSRIPVYEGTIDSVVGVFLVKDLLPVLNRRAAADPPFDVRAVMREPFFVPDTKPVNFLLAELRENGVHLAVVLDEFGGTYGLVTMEDLLEEIVGEIRDEYDEAEPDFESTPEGDVLIDGGTSICDVNEQLGLELPEEDFDTLGGYIFGALGRVPVVGDVVQAPGRDGEMELRVEETDERRVAVVRLARTAPVIPAAAE
jgi:CBS domain containing-hemolysin-like protein